MEGEQRGRLDEEEPGGGASLAPLLGRHMAAAESTLLH